MPDAKRWPDPTQPWTEVDESLLRAERRGFLRGLEAAAKVAESTEPVTDEPKWHGENIAELIRAKITAG